jgi:hypothetical protein
VLKLVPKAYSCEVTRFRLGVDSCEDTHAASPQPSEEEQTAAAAARYDEAATRAAAAGALAAPVSTAREEQSKEQIVHVTPSSQKSAKL